MVSARAETIFQHSQQKLLNKGRMATRNQQGKKQKSSILDHICVMSTEEWLLKYQLHHPWKILMKKCKGMKQKHMLSVIEAQMRLGIS